MPSGQDEVPEATVKAFQNALDDLQSHQLSDDEAVALFDMFPEGEYRGCSSWSGSAARHRVSPVRS